MKNNAELQRLRSAIIETIEKFTPSNVDQLKEMLRKKRKIEVSEDTLWKALFELRQDSVIELEPPAPKSFRFSRFRLMVELSDFWLILGGYILLIILMTLPPRNGISFLQRVIGILVTLVFPGYAVQMTLFPRKSDLRFWQRVVLSAGLSFAIGGFQSLILDQTPFGFTSVSVLVISLSLSLIFGIAGVIRRLTELAHQPSVLGSHS